MIRYSVPTIDTGLVILPGDDCFPAQPDPLGLAKYIETLDESKLGVLDGTPMRWRIRPLDTAALQKIKAKESLQGDLAEVFSAVRDDPDLTRSAARMVLCGVEPEAPEGWPKPMFVREKGRVQASEETIAALSDHACQVAVLAAIYLWVRATQLPLP